MVTIVTSSEKFNYGQIGLFLAFLEWVLVKIERRPMCEIMHADLSKMLRRSFSSSPYHTILKVKFLSKNSILTKLYSKKYLYFCAKKFFIKIEFVDKKWRFGIVCTLLLSTTNKIVFAWASCPWSWTVPCPLSFKIVDNNFYIAFSRWVLQVLMAHHLIAKL